MEVNNKLGGTIKKSAVSALTGLRKNSVGSVPVSTNSSFTPQSNSNSAITSTVVQIVVDKLGVNPREVASCASFKNDLGADSLDAVELMMEFEKEFGITIPDRDAERIQTVGDAISYIENRLLH